MCMINTKESCTKGNEKPPSLRSLLMDPYILITAGMAKSFHSERMPYGTAPSIIKIKRRDGDLYMIIDSVVHFSLSNVE